MHKYDARDSTGNLLYVLLICKDGIIINLYFFFPQMV